MSTEVIEYNATDKLGGNVARSSVVRDGIEGNKDIAIKMASLIRDSVDHDKGLENFVKKAGKDNLFGLVGYNSYDSTEQTLKSVFDFVQHHVDYITDIAGNVENIKSARQTLSDGYGDCDDHTVLVATILGILGFEPTLVLAGYGNEDNYSHIYTALVIDGKRYALDTTLPDMGFGYELPVTFKAELKPFDYIPQLDGIGSVFFRAKDALKHARSDAFTAIPTILNIVPTGLGYPLSMALQTALGFLNQDSIKNDSANAIGSRVNRDLDIIIVQLLHGSIAIDHAKVAARQAGTQLGLADTDDPNYRKVYASIKKKIDFINNFEAFANENKINLVHLNGGLMLVAGVTVIGFIAHHYISKRKRR